MIGCSDRKFRPARNAARIYAPQSSATHKRQDESGRTLAYYTREYTVLHIYKRKALHLSILVSRARRVMSRHKLFHCRCLTHIHLAPQTSMSVAKCFTIKVSFVRCRQSNSYSANPGQSLTSTILSSRVDTARAMPLLGST